MLLIVIFHIQILGLRPNFLGTEGMAYTKMPAGMDSGAPYLPGANLIKDRSTKCLGHPREAYGALREKKLNGRGSRPESYRYTWGNRALRRGRGEGSTSRKFSA